MSATASATTTSPRRTDRRGRLAAAASHAAPRTSIRRLRSPMATAASSGSWPRRQARTRLNSRTTVPPTRPARKRARAYVNWTAQTLPNPTFWNHR